MLDIITLTSASVVKEIFINLCQYFKIIQAKTLTLTISKHSLYTSLTYYF